MKILFISATPPWPQSHGARRRIAAQLEVLSEMGETTLIAPVIDSPPNGNYIVRGFEVSPWSSTAQLRLSWLSHPSLPFRVLPANSSLKAALRSTRTERYDVIWVHRLELWGAIRDLLPQASRIIVDADDLAVDALHQLASGPGTRPHLARARKLYVNEEIRRWDSLLRSAMRAGLVALSNPSHVARVGHPRCILIRNAMRPLGPYNTDRFECPHRTVGFVGLMSYPPNAQAALRLADGLADELKTAVPGTVVRVIGKISNEMRRLLDDAHLETTGFVDDLYSELARLDALVIPLTTGSGTRIKAVDAMAVGLPILSTAFGVQGLGLKDGSSVLIGESDADLAEAWCRLSTDRGFAKGIADAAYVEYQTSHSFETLRVDICAALHGS